MKKRLHFNLISGFSLVEVLVSISIVAIALIPLLGLIPIGLKNVQVSSEETHAVHLLGAVIQDFKYAKSTDVQSPIFKLTQLPFNGAKQNVVNRVWIDSCFNVYEESKKPNVMCFELEWIYTRVPDANNLSPVEASLTVRWPPNLNKEKPGGPIKGGEVTALAAFRKTQR